MFVPLVLYVCAVKYVLGANILYISMVPVKSHHIWNRAFAFGLANRGHNVTLLGPDEDREQPANYTHIYAKGVYKAIQDVYKALQVNLDVREFAKLNPTRTVLGYVHYTIVSCKESLQSQGLQQLLNYPPDFKFDLIIINVAHGYCFYPLIHRFNYPPTIGVTPFPLLPFLVYDIGSILQPSYNPWYGLPYNDNMTLTQRIWNTVFTYGEIACRSRIHIELKQELVKAFGEDVPSADKVKRHFSLLLSNHDHFLSYPQALTPNIIPVGGLHITSAKKLPKDLEVVLNSAKNGIIVFSLGTNIRSHDILDQNTQTSLLEAFGNLSEIVIWKFESTIDNLPKNVIVRKWLPQSDILGHAKVKLFIGHAGGLSTQEAIYHGVPMLCIPFFLDQHVNAKRIVSRNLGLSFDYRQIASDNFLAQIRKVLDNAVYSENMKSASRMYRNQMESPLKRAIFWAEYAMRHNGCDILNPRSRDIPFYTLFSFDVVAFFTVVCLIIYLLFSKVVHLLMAHHVLL